MSFMSEFSQPHIVWYAIQHFLAESRKYIALLKVYSKYNSKFENEFLHQSEVAILRELWLGVTKLFDTSCNKKDENCSIYLLRSLCVKNLHKFPGEEQDWLILKIDELCHKYQSMPFKKVRNKTLAHYDLKSAFNAIFPQICFESIEMLIEEYSTIISQVGERLVGVKLKFTAIDDLEKTYEKSLKDLMSK